MSQSILNKKFIPTISTGMKTKINDLTVRTLIKSKGSLHLDCLCFLLPVVVDYNLTNFTGL